MRVHIVCRLQPKGRILPRMAEELARETGWTIGPSADPNADVNYLFPYMEHKRQGDTGRSLIAGLFTHREDTIPKKVEHWRQTADAVDLRVTWAAQYADDLAPHGATRRILPPLDRERFHIAKRPAHDIPHAGVSGYVYAAGRKGERLLRTVLQRDGARRWHWSAVGRGWPVPTAEVPWETLPAWYQSLDLYVCPSLIEGVPYGPLEALACGVPVVIPRGVGLLDDLPDTTGIVRYNAGDADDLDAALVTAYELVSGGGDLPAIDREALRAATEPFTLDGWVRGHTDAFQELAGAVPDEMNARASDHGVFVVAYGDPARTCARRLITSIRSHMPDTPIAVVSDRRMAEADINIYHEDADAGGRTAKTKMYDLAPQEWQHVLYLDADTELTAPVPFLFGALRDGWELVVCKDINGYDLTHSLYRRDSLEMQLGLDALGSDRLLQLAGGVVGFRRTPAVAEMLGQWYPEWFRIGRRDQGALLRTLYPHPVRLLVLGNEWNTFDGLTEACAGIKHHRGGPARRIKTWRGRLDDPAWREAAGTGRYRNGNGRGVEGEVRHEPLPRFHDDAVVRITYTGPRAHRRTLGRSGRSYLFPRDEAVDVLAQDAGYITRTNEQVWEVGNVNCPVCGAENGVCKGEGIAANVARTSGIMETGKGRPMRLPRQHARRGRTGYIGEETGKVEVFENQTFGTLPATDTPPTDADILRGMTDDELAELGLQRIPSEDEEKEAKQKPKDKRRRAATRTKEAARA